MNKHLSLTIFSLFFSITCSAEQPSNDPKDSFIKEPSIDQPQKQIPPEQEKSLPKKSPCRSSVIAAKAAAKLIFGTGSCAWGLFIHYACIASCRRYNRNYWKELSKVFYENFGLDDIVYNLPYTYGFVPAIPLGMWACHSGIKDMRQLRSCKAATQKIKKPVCQDKKNVRQNS